MKATTLIAILSFSYCCETHSQENLPFVDEVFYVDIFGCEYPIPTRYVLNTGSTGIHFYIRDGFARELSPDEFKSAIDIMGFEEPDTERYGAKVESIYKNPPLELLKVSIGEYFAYSVTDKKSQIFFRGSDLNESEITVLTDRCLESSRESTGVE